MHREPATWSTRDRVTYYRQDAARLARMAEAERLSTARRLLADLARKYHRVADRLERKISAAA
jgi:hypothetical protein